MSGSGSERPKVQVFVLGGLRVIPAPGRRPLSKFRTRAAEGLLGYIACHRTSPVSRDSLMELLWPGEDPAATRQRLSQALSAVRQAIEPTTSLRGTIIGADRGSIWLRDSVDVDLDRFRDAVAHARHASNDDERAAANERVLDESAGQLLPGRTEDWVLRERDLVNRRVMQAIVHLRDRARSSDDPDRALDLARRAADLDPFDEPAHAEWFDLLVANGRRAEAIRQFRVLAHRLKSELGVEPAPDVVDRLGLTAPDDASAEEADDTAVTMTVLAVRGGDGEAAIASTPGCVLVSGELDAMVVAGRNTGVARKLLSDLRTASDADRLTVAADVGDVVERTDGAAAPCAEGLVDLLAASPPGTIIVTAAAAAVLDLPSDALVERTIAGRAVFELADAEPGAAPTPAALPPSRDRFFGREAELRTLRDAFDRPDDLVTLHGPGGVGKTRLAAELARRLRSDAPGGVWFVPLDTTQVASRILSTICRHVGVARRAGTRPQDAIGERLGSGRSLLVLDNLEHLLPEACDVVATLRDALPSTTILVTSRRAVSLGGEVVVAVAPLSVPSADATPREAELEASVQLFVDRARLCAPEFRLSERNAASISDLVRHVEGLPLAIELAAARAAVLTPANILARFRRRISLTDRGDTRAARHRTMSHVVDWSYRLLDRDTRSTFASLSAFSGSFDLDAVEAVATHALAADHVAELIDASLIRRTEDTPPRFRLLDTVREFASEKLSRSKAVRAGDRHAAHYTTLAEGASRLFTDDRSRRGAATLRPEADNLWAALHHLFARSTSASSRRDRESARVRGVALLDATAEFWSIEREASDAVVLLNRFLGDDDRLPEGSEAVARFQLGTFLSQLGRQSEAIDELDRARRHFDVLGNDEYVARTRSHLGAALEETGRPDEAISHLNAALDIARDLGHLRIEGQCLHNLGNAHKAKGHLDDALQCYEQALEIKRRRGAERDLPSSLLGMANIAESHERFGRAESYFREGIAAAETIGDQGLVAILSSGLGAMLTRIDRLDEGLELLVTSGRRLIDAGLARNVAICLVQIVSAPGIDAHAEWAAPLVGAIRRAIDRGQLADSADVRSFIETAADGLSTTLGASADAKMEAGRSFAASDLDEHLRSWRS